jgi:hypothetical protein
VGGRERGRGGEEEEKNVCLSVRGGDVGVSELGRVKFEEKF